MNRLGFYIKLTLTVVPLSLIIGCDIERLFPATVATGASRLSVEHMGMLLKHVADTQDSCGLASAKATISNIDASKSIKTATATYAVDNCVVDFGKETEISEDCLGHKTYASGKVKLNAKQIRHGILTSHDGHYAVIPWPKNQVEYELGVTEFDNYKIRVSNRYESLTVVSGQASAKMAVNLSHDPETGFCTVPTPELGVQHIQYTDAVLEVPGMFGRFRVPVQESNISAQAGTQGELTNHLSGKMTVWGEEVVVPNDKKGLDPEHDAAAHRESFQCRLKTDPWMPVNYQCDAKKELATHAARLLVLNTAMVVKESYDDKTGPFNLSHLPSFGCGFARYRNSIGTCNDDHRLIEVSDCDIGPSHSKPQYYDEDCNKEHLYILGQARVNGRLHIDESCTFKESKRTRPDSITFFLDSVKLKNFGAFYSMSKELPPKAKLLIRNGNLSAVVKPIFAESNQMDGQFDVLTPVAIFEELHLADADVELELNPNKTTEGKFKVSLVINDTRLFAQNGLFRGLGNSLRGEITVDGEPYMIGEVPLNPDFDADLFDSSYTCDKDLKRPIPSR